MILIIAHDIICVKKEENMTVYVTQEMGKNIRSADHLNMYGDKSFDKNDYEKYLKHEDINNLKGLEVEFVYKWNLGDLFIFDRTHLHCSSCNINGKKIGLATFTKK